MDTLAIYEMAYNTTLTIGAAAGKARALAAAIRRHGVFEMDGVWFYHRKDIVIPTNFSKSCRHSLVFQCGDGTGEQIKVTIEPVADQSHRSTDE